MHITATSALWFAPFMLPICIWVALSDLRVMRIPNVAVYASVAVFLAIGLIALPLSEYPWRLLQLAIVLLAGIALNAAGAVGAGDAKFAAAAAPFVAAGDLRMLMALFAANLLAAFSAHRIAKHTPLRKLAPHWDSWNRGSDFPMGLSLGATLAIYLVLGTIYGR
jgi:prepilin peptidase CpaA